MSHDPIKDPVEATVNRVLDDRIREFAAAVLPTLDQPLETVYETRQTNGIWRAVSVQEALLLRGKGRQMRLVMVWQGTPQNREEDA